MQKNAKLVTLSRNHKACTPPFYVEKSNSFIIECYQALTLETSMNMNYNYPQEKIHQNVNNCFCNPFIKIQACTSLRQMITH